MKELCESLSFEDRVEYKLDATINSIEELKVNSFYLTMWIAAFVSLLFGNDFFVFISFFGLAYFMIKAIRLIVNNKKQLLNKYFEVKPRGKKKK